jgi:hypothetical protein
MVERKDILSITRQCELIDKSRSWYYTISSKDINKIAIENKEKVIISEILNKYPHYGYRKVSLESQERKGETNEAFNV